MMVFSVPRVEVSSLSLGAPLGSGGQGRVVAVSGFRISGEWPAVLKTYSAEVAAELDASVLEKIVALPRQLPPGDGQWLLENTAWPAVIAEDQGRVCGFLMRTVPSAFYFGYRTHAQGTRRQLADTAFLLNSDSYISSAGLAVSDHDRLGLLASVAGALSRLHALGAVAGDFSPKNVLFSLRPAPSCFLIDCDAVQFHGESVFRQIDTPDWEVPDGEEKGTAATDAYKFGLLAIRLFARDQSARDPAALTAMSPELGRLAQLSQDPDPARRPAPKAWDSALAAAARTASTTTTTTAAAAPPAAPAPSRISVPVSPVASTAPAAASAALSRRARPLILTAAAAAAVITVGGIAGIHALSHPGTSASNTSALSGGGQGGAASGGGAQDSPGTQGASPAQPVTVGSVRIAPGIASDPAANAVAQMFNTYFSAINQQDYQTAASVFDPSGEFNPNDPSDVQAFANGLATTTDSRIVLKGLRPSGGQLARKARVTFRSHQAAGYGPAGNSGQTCTTWDLTYTLTQDGGPYLIHKVKGTHSRC
jgi:hypothetical protein